MDPQSSMKMNIIALTFVDDTKLSHPKAARTYLKRNIPTKFTPTPDEINFTQEAKIKISEVQPIYLSHTNDI